MSITLYTKPACVQCTATKRALDKAGLAYETVDVTEDAAAMERIKAAGHMSAPVVEIGGTVLDGQRGDAPVSEWAGFRPDLIAQLTA